MPKRLGVFLLTISFLAAGCSLFGSTAAPVQVLPDTHLLQQRTLDEIVRIVSVEYVYEDYQGADWGSVGQTYAQRLESELEPEEFATLVRELLAELPAGTARLETREERVLRGLGRNTTYEGIGAYVAVRGEPEPRILLLSTMPGSPAAEAGLQAHDAILAIDGISVREELGLEEVDRIRGESGTDVVLTVRSPGQEPREVAVTRGEVLRRAPMLTFERVDASGIGIIRFPPEGYSGLEQDLTSAIEALGQEEELAGLVLDLRIVSAGDGWPATPLLSLFTDGEIGVFYSRSEANVASVEGAGDRLTGGQPPVAVLIGPDTSGGAELFAAAVQEAGEGIVVGQNSSGEVERESAYYLPNGSRLLLATTSFRSLDGREIGLEGVLPDIFVDLDWDEIDESKDAAVDAAIQALARLIEREG